MDGSAFPNPFPGLRSFESDESHLFFGREGQSDELLRRLRRNRFLAVIGTSGSGKSSLVRAGLLPALHGGFMAEAPGSWWVACFRPGNDPIGNLAQALAEIPGFAPAGARPGCAALGVETTLQRCGLGLLDAARQARLPAGQSLLVVVDQFEELFRFQQSVDAGHRGDAAAFVKLLLEATAPGEVPVYVVLTMRSDYLGDCAQFRDLPERLNDAQYLIPRMTRDQRRQAVTGPVLVGGGRIAPRLVNRLLNEVGDNPDQLPILQHALMRTWDLWARGGAGGEIDVEHYEAVGGMAAALSRHADEAYEELSDSRRGIAEVLFKRLTEKGPDNREIRLPTRLAELATVAGASEDEVTAVLESFRREGRSFLMPRSDVPLAGDAVLDISHESLIRGWQRLRAWVDEETQSAQIYRRVADAAARNAEGKAALWRDPDLAQALRWRTAARPNASWAERYNPGFAPAMAFLDASQREHLAAAVRQERARVRLHRLTVTLTVLFVLAGGLAFYAGRMKAKADDLLVKSYWSSALHASGEEKLLKAARFFGLYIRDGGDPSLREDGARRIHRFTQALLVTPSPEATIARVKGKAFSPEGSRLAAWSTDGTFLLWDFRRGGSPGLRRAHPKVSGAVFSRDGSLLLTWSADGTARLWRTRDGSAVAAPLPHGDHPVEGGVFSPDGALVLTWSEEPASASASGPYGLPPSSQARLWRTADGAAVPLPAALLNRHAPILGAAFSPDGRTFLLWSGKDAQLWSLGPGPTEPWQILHEITGATFSPDGRLVLAWGVDGAAQLWKAADGSRVELPMQHETAPLGASFSSDARQILTWGLDGARLWTRRSFRPPLAIRPPADILAAELGGARILTTHTDGTARLWDADSGALQAELFHGESLAAAKLVDGHQILTWGKDGARLWDVKSRLPTTDSGRADLDFPREDWPLLVEVATGVRVEGDNAGQVLSPGDWQEKKEEYVQEAEEHLQTCKFRHANLYDSRQKVLWSKSGKDRPAARASL